ncbi:MAG: aminoacyl-histidine dipeptidase [Candidatus Thermoplasmatota archaeon]|nr:aminoacyl-histidine dipeptidase [Candidatus Thermoplasmatota archaeon]
MDGDIMDPVMEGLEPRLLWKHFDELRKIPRCSRHEERAIAYVVSVADRLGLKYKKDDMGNIVVRKPASPGHENAPIVVLQGHVDMVCEKNKEVPFDFSTDAIKLRMEGEYLYATGTTLGADNGIGVCAALAVLEDKDLVHGPIEALFTVDEETGLTGAFSLGEDMLEGRLMINLDTEEERALYVGCAGGGESEINMPVLWEEPLGNAFHINFSGMKGGHSGVDIHLGKANAVKLLARMLWKAARAHDLSISNFSGGDKHNAIPREAEAVVVTRSDPSPFKDIIMKAFEEVRFEYRTLEPGMDLKIKDIELPSKAMTEEDSRRMLHLVVSLPHGVQRMSPDIKDLVETSTSMAKIRTEDDVYIQLASRSSSSSQLEALRDRIEAIVVLAGGEAGRGKAYPGWLPNLDSSVLAVLKASARELWGRDPEIKAIHAGLETGIIGEKYPGMDMASMGPQIENPHSPDERVRAPSVRDFWDLLSLSLKKLA